MPEAATPSNNAVYERARQSRDARFDGRFFVGVRTTGIYCRPICPAVVPKAENVSFYPSAAAAAEAGFRPCLRCRPECAPGTPAWSGTSTTVRRGLRLIAGGALDDGSLEQLAERLGVSGRHLRRLFAKHIGASPLAIAHTQRLQLAKRLIDDSGLALGDVAIAAGFGSVRRFNDAFVNCYGRTPSELRRRRAAAKAAGDALTLRLTWRQPYDWGAMLGFLAARCTTGVEQVIGDRYLRSVRIDGQAGIMECRPEPQRGGLAVTLHGLSTVNLLPSAQRVRDMFDLDAPPDDIAGVLGTDPLLAALLAQRPGVRVPGSWDAFELSVRAILGQQVSVRAATTIAGRIAASYGEPLAPPESLSGEPALAVNRLFPTPQRLARAHYKGIGLTTARRETLQRLAAAVAAGDIDFDSEQDPETLCRQLTALRGIGDWTAQYIAMRALKHPDALPVGDLGLVRAAGCDAAALARRAQGWRPWRAYAAMLLWGSLEHSGG